MRIVVLTPALEAKGGAERIIYKIARHFDATIHCMRYDPDNTYDGFRDIHVETPEKTALSELERRYIRPLQRARYFYNLKLEDCDLVNAHIEPAEFARRRNSPMIWYCNSPYRWAFDLYDRKMKNSGMLGKAAHACTIAAFKRIEYGIVPGIEHVFTSSANSRSRIRRYLKRDAELLYPGIDTGGFACKDFERYFFYPSRIIAMKDFEYAIEAFRMFSSRVKGWKLVLGGYVDAQPQNQEYLKKLRAMCGDSVSIVTDLDEERLRELYSRCHAVLFSPVDEDLGLVPLEGMASSKPCIAKNEGGPRETVIDGVDGFLVNSPAEMADRMEFLARNPEQCVLMGKAGRKKVEARFTWELFFKRFGEKARELVDGRSGSA